MGTNKRGVLRVAVPALTLLAASSLWVAGAQGPGRLPVERERTFSVTTGGDTDADIPQAIVNEANCSFLQDPLRHTEDQEYRNAMRSSGINRAIRWTVSLDGTTTGIVNPNDIRRNNFIDDEIFTRMASANIRSAPLSGDAEFLRRVTLDLTGRIPTAAEVSSFLADGNSNKRDTRIDALIASPEFVDKWTMFFGDLFQNNVTSAQVTRGVQGRDAFYTYIKNAIAQNTPYDAIARTLMTASGDTFAVGQANWPVGNTVSMGPAQDTYDGAAVDVASMFMGINAVDCILCHDGPRHLDQVSIWGTAQTRMNMWGFAAYFSQTRMTRNGTTGSTVVSDDPTLVGYRLNTNAGNRVPRQPVNGISNVPPRYPFSTSGNPGSGILSGESRRAAIARLITADLQFSRATANYVWEKLMVEPLVSPSNGFDLARLDPNNPPPAPWTLQPTNPQLLDRLARDFQTNGYDLRTLIGKIVKSSAYQLSSTYNGEWRPNYVTYYARKYVRRLDAEEIHDAVVRATGIQPTYTFTSPGTPLPAVQWAMQLPDTREPTTNNAVVTFLNAFGRGDRDVNPRRFDGSVLQGLTLMNNTFVTQKIHNANMGSRVRTLLASSTDPNYIINQLYLNTLSRPATTAEISAVLPNYQQLGNLAATEDLQWVLLNRLQFLFNY
jgi:hypothetical protein